eukprot:4612268-Pleurochrysis_carterae.AAC.3
MAGESSRSEEIKVWMAARTRSALRFTERRSAFCSLNSRCVCANVCVLACECACEYLRARCVQAPGRALGCCRRRQRRRIARRRRSSAARPSN